MVNNNIIVDYPHIHIWKETNNGYVNCGDCSLKDRIICPKNCNRTMGHYELAIVEELFPYNFM